MLYKNSGKTDTLVRQFLHYLFPSVASLMSLSLYILADTFFIARGVGSVGLTALNIAIPAYSIVTATGLMLGMGSGVLVAISRGGGDRETADRVFGCVLWSAVVIGLAFSISGAILAERIALLLGASADSVAFATIYIRTLLSCSVFFILNNTLVTLVRNDGNPRLAMASMVANSLCNVVLDYLFVIVLRAGMLGAAVATCISPVIGIGLISLHWIKKKNTLTLRRERPHLRLLGRILRGGASSFLMEIGNGIVILLFNLALLSLSGDVGVAAYGIIANIALVISYIFIGVGQGIQPVLGQNFGEGKPENCVRILKMGAGLSAGAGLLFLIVGFAFPEQLATAFNSEGNLLLQELTVQGIPIYFTAFLVMGVNICFASYFQSTMRANLAVGISILRSLVLVALGIWLLPGVWGITGVWLVVPAAESATLLLLCIYGLVMYTKKGLTSRRLEGIE